MRWSCTSAACATSSGGSGCCRASPTPRRRRRVGRFVWLRAGAGGWWEPAVRAGDESGRGRPRRHDAHLYGDVIEQAVTPQDGVVLFVTTSPAVEDGGLLLGLGADVRPLERAAG